MSTAAILLAAGFSRRLGRPKQTIVLAGETLGERAVRLAQQAGLDPVIAVVNPEGDFGHSLQQRGCILVVNQDAAEGLASSIRRGVNAAKLLQASGAVLMACDQIALTPAHLRSLCEQPRLPAGSAYAGRVGIPAYFPATSFDALLRLEGDSGARELLRGARAVPAEELSFDIDTEDDLPRARAFLEEREPPPASEKKCIHPARITPIL